MAQVGDDLLIKESIFPIAMLDCARVTEPKTTMIGINLTNRI